MERDSSGGKLPVAGPRDQGPGLVGPNSHLSCGKITPSRHVQTPLIG